MNTDCTIHGNNMWKQESGIAAEVSHGISARNGIPMGEVCEVEKAQLFDTIDEANCAASFYPGPFPDGYPKFYRVTREVTVKEIVKWTSGLG